MKYHIKHFNKIIVVLVFFVFILFLAGCVVSMDIYKVKTKNFVGKDVTVTGIVQGTVKIGSVSAYILKDDTAEIGVITSRIPNKGDRVTVSGVVMKDTIFGYYIKAG